MIGVGTWERELKEVWMRWGVLLKVSPKRRKRTTLVHGNVHDRIMVTIHLP
jgi:hypothetical protein